MITKLIRDKIPEIMEANGQQCNYAVVKPDAFYEKLLIDKLYEEIEEFKNAGSLKDCTEELADVITVCNALRDFYSIQKEDLEACYDAKYQARGGFEKRYIGFFEEKSN